MCGIVAVASVDGSPVKVDQVRKMTSTLNHRGPDGRGLAACNQSGTETSEQEARVVLGHCRLAVLNLQERAAQPMTRHHATVAFNGEIYNFMKLRAELQHAHFEFTTMSDTELLLAAYHQLGTDFLKHLNGIFALVIWDHRARRLLAARNRLGVKPIYWMIDAGHLM